MESVLTSGGRPEEGHRSKTAELFGKEVIDQATRLDLIAVSPWLACREDLDSHIQNDHAVSPDPCIGRWEDDGGRAYERRPNGSLGR